MPLHLLKRLFVHRPLVYLALNSSLVVCDRGPASGRRVFAPECRHRLGSLFSRPRRSRHDAQYNKLWRDALSQTNEPKPHSNVNPSGTHREHAVQGPEEDGDVALHAIRNEERHPRHAIWECGLHDHRERARVQRSSRARRVRAIRTPCSGGEACHCGVQGCRACEIHEAGTDHARRDDVQRDRSGVVGQAQSRGRSGEEVGVGLARGI